MMINLFLSSLHFSLRVQSTHQIEKVQTHSKQRFYRCLALVLACLENQVCPPASQLKRLAEEVFEYEKTQTAAAPDQKS